MIAAALVGKKIIINKINPSFIKSEIQILKKMGVRITVKGETVIILKSDKIKKINVSTQPYPGFPTDLQAQLMVLMTRAKGQSKITEKFLRTGLCMYLN